MEGNAKIVKLIARDEAVHLSGTQHMINRVGNGQDDFSGHAVMGGARGKTTVFWSVRRRG